MVQPQQLFGTDPGKITDFSGVPVSEIFNQTVVPRLTSIAELFDLSAGLDEAKQRREARLAQTAPDDLYKAQQVDPFASQSMEQPAYDNSYENYNAPLPMSTPSEEPGTFDKTAIKLANYGYASDTTKDYNSNVAKIGHANNKLESGVSAALTKSLAKRYGLKTGDYFEAITADGKVLRRRYDDTVPSTYKGKALPETVDLYEQSGSNKFGGTVVGLRTISK